MADPLDTLDMDLLGPKKNLRGNLFSVFIPGSKLTQLTWEGAVKLQLHGLFDVPPNRTSQAVQHALNATKKKVFISPTTGLDNTVTIPIDPAAANAEGPHLQCTDNPATPQDDRGTVDLSKPYGTGRGSDSWIFLTPQDYYPYANVPGLAPDEALLHELVHALRDTRGQSRCVAVPPPAYLRRLSAPAQRKYSQEYENIEEFLAIVIANIYRSENQRPGLRTDDGNPLEPGSAPVLAYPFTDAEKFYGYWSAQLDGLCRQMLRLFIHLANVPAAWNPIRYSVMSVLHLDRSERLRDFEATLTSNDW